MKNQDTVARAKQADLASSSGAGILGAGLGALLIEFVRPELARLAVALVVIGIVLTAGVCSRNAGSIGLAASKE